LNILISENISLWFAIFSDNVDLIFSKSGLLDVDIGIVEKVMK